MDYDDKKMFRLIANPYRISKTEEIVKTSSTDDLLSKYLKIAYKNDDIYLNNHRLQEIKQIIDHKINEYKIQKISKELVERCIQNALQKFENNI